jgi:hypothetical protein
MRRIGLLVSSFAVTLGLGLAGPPPAAACVGCSTTFKELVDGSPSIVLANYRGRSGSHVMFDVIDVLKGPDIRSVLFLPTGLLGGRTWGSWLLAPVGDMLAGAVKDGGAMTIGFRVSAGGAVKNAVGGEGAVVGYPLTLAGWYRTLGLSMPDTATTPGPRLSAPAVPTPLAVPLLLLAAIAGASAALLRRERT